MNICSFLESNERGIIMLDQYAIGVPLEDAISDFEIRDDNIGDFFYWQDNEFIQNWMEKLYDEKHGSDILEDGVYLRIDGKDLERIKNDLAHENIPISEYKENLKFIEKAEYVIRNFNMVVYYTSSW